MSVDRIRGMQNVPLNIEGVQQGVYLAKRIRAKGGVDRVISSPLIRSKATSNLVVNMVPGARLSYTSKSLEPWHLGQYEGMESEKAYPELEKYVRSPKKVVPGSGMLSLIKGESFQDFITRYYSFLDFLLDKIEDKERVLAMSHYRNVKATFACEHLQDMKCDPDDMCQWPDTIGTANLFHVRRAKTMPGRIVVKPIVLENQDMLPYGLLLGRHGSTDLNASTDSKRSRNVDKADFQHQVVDGEKIYDVEK